RERGAHAAGRLRPGRHGAPAPRRRAGDRPLARRRRPPGAARAGGRLDRQASLGSATVAYEFKLPDLGEGLTEGEIARWLVKEGQEIAEDDPLVEIQTDKTTVEIPSPAGGTVARILAAAGDVMPVGTVLVVIGEDGAAPEESPRAEPTPGAAKQAGRARATPLVR